MFVKKAVTVFRFRPEFCPVLCRILELRKEELALKSVLSSQISDLYEGF
jgi:hypothetical protein